MNWSDDQVRAMHRMYVDEDISLAEVGARQDPPVTRERIRQLFKQHGLLTRGYKGLHEIAVRRNAEIATARRDEILESYKRHGNIPKVARELAIPKTVVRTVVESLDAREIYRSRTRAHATRFSLDDMAETLREAAQAKGEPLSSTNYKAWRQEQAAKPTYLAIFRAFGSWTDALDYAGVKSNPGKPRKDARAKDEQCRDALRQCRTDLGRIPSMSAYDGWTKGHEDAPKVSTVRSRLGGWTNALIDTFDIDA